MRNYGKATLCLLLRILLPSLLIIGSVILNVITFKTIEMAELTALYVILWCTCFVFEIIFLISWGSRLMKDGVLRFFNDASENESSYLEIKKVSNDTYKVEEKKNGNSVVLLLWAFCGIIVAVFSIFIFIGNLIAIAFNKKLCDKYANSIKKEVDIIKPHKIFMIVSASVFCFMILVTIIVQSVYKVNIFNAKKNETMNINYGSKYISATVSKKINEESCSDIYGVYYPIVLNMTINNDCKKDIVIRYDFELVIYDASNNKKLFSSEHECLGYIDSGVSEDIEVYVFSTNPDIQNYELSQLKIDFRILFADFKTGGITYQYSEYVTIFNGAS